MNIVDYGIRMKDMASAPLGKFAQSVRNSMPVTQRFAANAVRMSTVYKESYNELQRRIRETENIIRNSRIKSEIRKARQELASLQKQAAKRGIDGGGTGKGGGMFRLPDLRGRFIVGKNDTSNESEYGTIGNAGGEKKHTLTVNEMPSHKHGYMKTKWGERHIKHSDGTGEAFFEHTNAETTSAGDNQSHENRPPYYVLAYIMRTK